MTLKSWAPVRSLLCACCWIWAGFICRTGQWVFRPEWKNISYYCVIYLQLPKTKKNNNNNRAMFKWKHRAHKTNWTCMLTMEKTIHKKIIIKKEIKILWTYNHAKINVFNIALFNFVGLVCVFKRGCCHARRTSKNQDIWETVLFLLLFSCRF